MSAICSETKDKPIIRGVVLAGAPNDGALENEGEDYEALIDVCGVSMVQYVIDALADAATVDGISLVGFAEFSHRLNLEGVELLQAGEDLPDSIERGLKGTEGADYILYATSDAPLLRGEMIDDFVRRCLREEGGEFFASAVTRGVSEEAFPRIHRTYAHLAEGDITLGNCFMGTSECILRTLPALRRLYRIRKSIWRMGLTLGPALILRYLLGRASLGDLEVLFRRTLGAEGRAIISPYAEMAVDVDKSEHLRAVRRLIAGEGEMDVCF